MFQSAAARFAAACLVGLTAAGIVLGIAAGLDGAFFQPKEQMAVVPCYFTKPDPLAMADVEPGVPSTATGCLPTPEHDNGVTGFFARMMGASPKSDPASLLDPPPARSDLRP